MYNIKDEFYEHATLRGFHFKQVESFGRFKIERYGKEHMEPVALFDENENNFVAAILRSQYGDVIISKRRFGSEKEVKDYILPITEEVINDEYDLAVLRKARLKISELQATIADIRFNKKQLLLALAEVKSKVAHSCDTHEIICETLHGAYTKLDKKEHRLLQSIDRLTDDPFIINREF